MKDEPCIKCGADVFRGEKHKHDCPIADGGGVPRRGFLAGIFGGLVSGGLLVKTATLDEVQAFAAPLAADAPLRVETPVLPFPGQHLYNEEGQLVAVVTSFKATGSSLTAHLVSALQWQGEGLGFRFKPR
jgi:hypothetical protein